MSVPAGISVAEATTVNGVTHFNCHREPPVGQRSSPTGGEAISRVERETPSSLRS
jgi:hypothetical protein